MVGNARMSTMETKENINRFRNNDDNKYAMQKTWRTIQAKEENAVSNRFWTWFAMDRLATVVRF